MANNPLIAPQLQGGEAWSSSAPGLRPLLLLHCCSSLQLRQGEHAPYVLLLELFCYGTWPEYKGV